jgi:ketosteroid isomerase-like protein
MLEHRLRGLAVATLMALMWPAAAVPDAPPQAAADAATMLRESVAALDRRMFDAYNAHDVDQLMALFADDLEFYHDTGGLLGHAQVRQGFTNVFANNKDIRRDLVPGSLEVYPIKDHGAIEIGAHRFCHTENGKDDCGTFRFVHIWRLKDGAWQVARAVSYGH